MPLPLFLSALARTRVIVYNIINAQAPTHMNLQKTNSK